MCPGKEGQRLYSNRITTRGPSCNFLGQNRNSLQAQLTFFSNAATHLSLRQGCSLAKHDLLLRSIPVGRHLRNWYARSRLTRLPGRSTTWRRTGAQLSSIGPNSTLLYSTLLYHTPVDIEEPFFVGTTGA